MSSVCQSLEARVEARVASGAVELPVFPTSAQEVMRLCDAAEVDFRKLADVIRRDAMLAAHFLAMANSPAFGTRVPLVSLQQALTRLGVLQTKQIAVVIACKTRFFKIPGRPERADELLTHALDTALAAQEIARRRRLNVEEAFLGGLLHDIGRPAVLQLCVELDGDRLDHTEAETCADRLHEPVGAAIVAHWGLPAAVRSVIGGHHASTESPHVAIVQLADLLVQGTPDLVTHPAANLLNLYPEDISALTPKRSAA